MNNNIFSIITGTGRYIPTKVMKNINFSDYVFVDSTGEKLDKANDEIIDKFQHITGIEERTYIEDEFVSSDIGFFSAQAAIATSKINKEDLDYIIVAHNFGDVQKANVKVDTVPSIASRIKFKLGIKNPYTVGYDILFGCPGWLQAMFQANYYIQSGDAKKVLVIGTETLSRVSDPHDRDSMIYSDGAGAVVVEATESDTPVGIITHLTRTDAVEHAYLLRMEKSANPKFKNDTLFLKMDGRKLYEYALRIVPQAIKDCITKAGLFIGDIKKVLIHQANEKMDDAILSRLYRLFNVEKIPKNIMPMTIAKLGNSSVATLPIMFDFLVKGELENHRLGTGDHVVFASVGAGMNVNAMVYKMP
jgi:3-oxoacyl-[acyl-carrier-protein] synthase-3